MPSFCALGRLNLFTVLYFFGTLGAAVDDAAAVFVGFSDRSGILSGCDAPLKAGRVFKTPARFLIFS